MLIRAFVLFQSFEIKVRCWGLSMEEIEKVWKRSLDFSEEIDQILQEKEAARPLSEEEEREWRKRNGMEE